MLESVHIQRDATNSWYSEVNISGSDLIIYHDETGLLTADNVNIWATKYGIGSGGSGGSTFATQSLYATQSLTASYVAFDGNRSITRNDPSFDGITVGGTTVVDFLNNFFFPFSSATVNINTGATYYQTGSVQTVTANGTVTLNSETVFGSGSVWKSGTQWQNFNIPGYSYSFNDTNVSTNQTYETFVQVGNNGSPTLIHSSINSVNFIYPFLYGMSATPGLSGTALYNALSKDVSPFGNKSHNLIGTAVYIYFAYPSTYADLVHVYDPNLFDIITSFTETIVSVTSTGLINNWAINYKVYQLELVADPFGVYQFNFS